MGASGFGEGENISRLSPTEQWLLQGRWRVGRWKVSRLGGSDNYLAPDPEEIEKILDLIRQRQRLEAAKSEEDTVVVGSADFQPVSFLQEGAARSRAVCRIAREFSLPEFRHFIGDDIQQRHDLRSFNSVRKLIDIFSIPAEVVKDIFVNIQSLILSNLDNDLFVEIQRSLLGDVGDIVILSYCNDLRSKIRQSLTQKNLDLDDADRYGSLETLQIVFDQDPAVADAIFRLGYLEALKVIDASILAKLNPLPVGTGFLVGGNHILTNQHVIPDEKVAEQCIAQFGYIQNARGQTQASIDFGLNPRDLFLSNPDLDYTLVQVNTGYFTKQAGYDLGWITMAEDAQNITPGWFTTSLGITSTPAKQIADLEMRLRHYIQGCAKLKETAKLRDAANLDNATLASLSAVDEQQVEKILDEQNRDMQMHVERTKDNGFIVIYHPSLNLMDLEELLVQNQSKIISLLPSQSENSAHSSRPDLPPRCEEVMGDKVFIIQHPRGQEQQIVLRDNNVIPNGLYRNFLRYRADSDYGSSGSPVFNEKWQLVALHHAAIGDQSLLEMRPDSPSGQEGTSSNGAAASLTALSSSPRIYAQQGVRICRILEDLKQKSLSNPKLRNFIDDFAVTVEQLNYPPLPAALEFDGVRSFVSVDGEVAVTFAGTRQDGTVDLIEWSKGGVQLSHVPMMAGKVDGEKLGNQIWLSQDGQKVAVAGQKIVTKDGDRYPIELRDRSGTLPYMLTDHSAMVTCARFSPDGQLLATGSADRTVKLWNVRSGQWQATLACSDAVVDVVFKPNSEEVVASSKDGQLRWWDRSGKELRTYSLDSLSAIARQLTFSPSGQKLAFVNFNNLVELLTLAPEPSKSTLLSKDNFSQVREIEISPANTGDEIIAVYHSSKIHLWDKQGVLLNPENPIENPSSFVRPKLSPDGQLLATGSDNQVNLWNTQGKLLGSVTLGEESYLIREIQFSLQRQSDGDQQLLMAVAAYGQQFGKFQFHLYQLSWQGQELQLIRLKEINHNEGSGTEFGIDFSSDGNLLVTNDGLAITVWNLAEISQPEVARLTIPDSYFQIIHLSLSHDGQVIAFTVSTIPNPLRSRQEPADVFFWNWKTTRSTVSLDVEELPQLDFGGAINSIQFFHTRFLFLTSGGNGICVYTFDENQQPQTLAFRLERNSNVQISPDDRTISFITDQCKVKLWRWGNNEITLLAGGESHQISAIALSQDTLVTSHLDVIQSWNLDGTVSKTFGSSQLVNDCSFSLQPTEQYLFTTGKDGMLKVWDLQDPNQPRLVTESSTRNSEALGMATGSHKDDSLLGNLIASANQDSRIELWRMLSQSQLDIKLERLNLPPILLPSSQDRYVGGYLSFNPRHQEAIQNQGWSYSVDHYSFGGETVDDTLPFSIEAWINPYPDGVGGTVISKWREDNQGEYLLAITPQGTVRFSLRAPQPSEEIYTLESSRRLSFGQFHHLVASFDGKIMQLYLDGEIASPTVTLLDNGGWLDIDQLRFLAFQSSVREVDGYQYYQANNSLYFQLQEPNINNDFRLRLRRGHMPILRLDKSWDAPVFQAEVELFSFAVSSFTVSQSIATYWLNDGQFFEIEDYQVFLIEKVVREPTRLVLWTKGRKGSLRADPLTPVLIGAHFSDPANVKSSEQITTGFFKGSIAEVRIWNKAISIAQIQTNMHRRVPAESSGLIGYWRFEESVGDRVANLAAPDTPTPNTVPVPSYGRVLNATWLNASRFPTLPLPSSLRFNGEDAYVDCGNITQITDAITVEAWVKHCSGDGLIVHRGGGWQDGGYSLFWYRGKIRVELQGTSSKAKLTIDTQENAPSDNTWHHIGFTWTEKLQQPGKADKLVQEVEVYVDGRRQNVIAVTGESKNILSGGLYKSVGIFKGRIGEQKISLTIGGMTPEQLRDKQRSVIYFDGAIAEVRLWKVARTQNEIKANMYRRLNAKQEPNLIGYWRMDEKVTASQPISPATGETSSPVSDTLAIPALLHEQVRDLTANNFHGTIYKADWFPLVAPVSDKTRHSTLSPDAPDSPTPDAPPVPLDFPTPDAPPVSLDFPTPDAPPVSLDFPTPDAPPVPPDGESRVLVSEVNVVLDLPNEDLLNKVYSVILTHPGRATSRSQLIEDINNILATGVFSNAKMIPEDTPLGVRVTFVVNVLPDSPIPDLPPMSGFSTESLVLVSEVKVVLDFPNKSLQNKVYSVIRTRTGYNASSQLDEDINAILKIGEFSNVRVISEATLPFGVKVIFWASVATPVPQFVRIEKTERSPSTPTQFKDLIDHWAEERIVTLAKLGIIKGFPDGTFRPDQAINRAEFAAILSQAFNPTYRPLQAELSDVPADFWARTAIERVVGSRLMAMAVANQFAPKGDVPRLQAVITLVNALLRKQKALPTPDRTMLSFFTDIDALQPSVQNRIAIAIQLGIVAKSSKSNTTFRPDQVVTRAEVSVMLLQVLAALESSQPPEPPPVVPPTVPPVVPPAVPPAANPNPEFTDLKDHPAKDKILALVSRGIFTGFPDRTFKPDQSMLRAEFAAILVRAFQSASSTSKIEFRDVPANFWAWSVIQLVAANGLMAGISANQFGPKQPITQLQTVVGLVHCLRKQQKPLPTPDRTALSFFADINTFAAEEKDCIAIAIQLGWIARSSRSNSQFKPNSSVTRATVATILLQALSV